MGSPRRTTRHLEAIEDFGEQLTLLVATVEDSIHDGRIEASEDQLLHGIMSRTVVLYQRLPAEAAVIDGGVRIVATMLNTLSPTEWVTRLIREGAEDEQGLIEDGYIEPITVDVLRAA